MIEYAILAVAVAALCCGLRGSGMALAGFATTGIARPLMAPLRAGYAVPYEGAGLMLFLATEVALFVLPPAVIVWALGWPKSAAAIWLCLLVAVAVMYPGVRGDDLLRFYAAAYLAVYGTSAAVLTWRGARADGLSLDQLGLLLVVLAGAAAAILVMIYGAAQWSLTWIPNGASAALVLALALVHRRRRSGSPLPPRDDD
ncbi:hypothetical protein BE21_57455 [Sorangium cellulosum]|uniref:Uncharacterized protein n=1 Tax=Sorangium cellulosum TaxID=56 RepID=A0A150U371_SORCE|nr:hypothetical protein BE21_57455 [Sorangium cellulosum]